MSTDDKKHSAPQATVHNADGTVAPFVDDIVIWANNLDSPRVLTADALQQLPKVSPTILAPINSLIQQGVVVAAIPSTSGIGASCYLLNLTAIVRPDDPES
jgi:hypothetical protein